MMRTVSVFSHNPYSSEHPRSYHNLCQRLSVDTDRYSVDSEDSLGVTLSGTNTSSMTASPKNAIMPANTFSAIVSCIMCNARTTTTNDSTAAYCSRRCAWTACGLCAQCGGDNATGGIYCSVTCSSESAYCSWCPNCAVVQIDRHAASCSRCKYLVPMTAQRTSRSRGEAHKLIDSSDKEHKALMKQWKGVSKRPCMPSVHNVVKLVTPAAQRKSYLAHRLAVDAELQVTNASKYLHGGEGNELRRFYATIRCCDFGSNPASLSPCSNPECTACFAAVNGYLPPNAVGFSSADRAIQTSLPNSVGERAVIVARVVAGSVATPYTPSTRHHHSTVYDYTKCGVAANAAAATSCKSKNPKFFPSAVDDGIVVVDVCAVDPILLVVC